MTKLGKGLLRGLKEAVRMEYKDPLHFSFEQLTARFGEKSITLNKSLLDHQNAWGNLDKILAAHEFKLMIYEMIEETNVLSRPSMLADDLTLVEYHLQELWGFPQDRNYHKFWNTPRCRCPKMDNDDSYPSGIYSVNQGCGLHWVRKIVRK